MSRRDLASSIEGPTTVDAPELVCTNVIAGVTSIDGQRHVTLRVTVEPGRSNASSFMLDLGGREGGLSPYLLAADLMAAGDAILRLEAIETGADATDAQAALRKVSSRMRRKANRVRREQSAALVAASHCHACPRPVAFIVDGTAYCKRHAEEAGVRPRGKIT